MRDGLCISIQKTVTVLIGGLWHKASNVFEEMENLTNINWYAPLQELWHIGRYGTSQRSPNLWLFSFESHQMLAELVFFRTWARQVSLYVRENGEVSYSIWITGTSLKQPSHSQRLWQKSNPPTIQGLNFASLVSSVHLVSPIFFVCVQSHVLLIAHSPKKLNRIPWSFSINHIFIF